MKPCNRRTKSCNLLRRTGLNPDGSTGFKAPSTIDELRNNPEFLEDAKDAVVAFVEYPARAHAAE